MTEAVRPVAERWPPHRGLSNSRGLILGRLEPAAVDFSVAPIETAPRSTALDHSGIRVEPKQRTWSRLDADLDQARRPVVILPDPKALLVKAVRPLALRFPELAPLRAPMQGVAAFLRSRLLPAECLHPHCHQLIIGKWLRAGGTAGPDCFGAICLPASDERFAATGAGGSPAPPPQPTVDSVSNTPIKIANRGFCIVGFLLRRPSPWP